VPPATFEQTDNSKKVRRIQWLVGIVSVSFAFAVDVLLPGWGEATILTLLVFGGLFCLSPSEWQKRSLFWVVSTSILGLHLYLVIPNHNRIAHIGALLILLGMAEALAIVMVLGIVLDKVLPQRTK